MTREFPLLFSDPMALAAVEGRKTQTRRLLSPKHVTIDGDTCPRAVFDALGFDRAIPSTLGSLLVPESGRTNPASLHAVFTRYQPGDVLWGREACRIWWDGESVGGVVVEYRAGGDNRHVSGYGAFVGGAFIDGGELADKAQTHSRWRSAMHMPRRASRLVFTLTDVRFERLQDISEEDARAEGVLPLGADPSHYLPAVEMFWRLWNSINEHRAPWSSNPWVVVYDWGTK